MVENKYDKKELHIRCNSFLLLSVETILPDSNNYL